MIIALMLAIGSVFALSADVLKNGFANPPNRAKPRVWWHWMNGNVSKEGITADLEAMASAGIGGAHIFDVGCNVPAGEVKFATPSWDEHLKWAICEAERLGLELTLVNCSGYANAGGPWVAPSNSMFFVTYSETLLKGGARYTNLKLPRQTNDNGFYRDIATVAFPRPKCEMDVPSDFKAASSKANEFVFSASQPFTLRGLEFSIDFKGSSAWEWFITFTIETSDDGQTWTKHDPLEYRIVNSGKSDCDHAKGDSRFAAFANPLTTRNVRITADFSKGFLSSKSPARLVVCNPLFRRALPQLNDRLFRTKDIINSALCSVTAAESVNSGRVINLADSVSKDGVLSWAPPSGDDWVVVRLGYYSNGVKTHPCSELGSGLEVDKLDPSAVARHLDAYVLKYAKYKSVVSVLCDSYEIGSQNWTHNFEKTFERRKGYSIIPYLAVAISGRILGSFQETDNALRDYRRLLSDLFAENFAGTFAKKCAEHGVSAAFEPYGDGPFDDTSYAWRATQPMTEFWVDEHVGASLERSGSTCQSVKELASVAHLKGLDCVDAEGFTAFPERGGKWLKDPFGLKAMGDLMYAQGVSRMVYHRWAHQPWTSPARLPGMTMGPWGTHFERTETWWPMVGPWLKYQARCQYLLQQGSFVADVLVFTGDDIPRQNVCSQLIPKGVDWDLCGRDALTKLKVVNGRIRCLSETSYALLLVPTNVMIAADSSAKIESLKRAGARVVSEVPSSWLPDFWSLDSSRELVAHHRFYSNGREGYFVAYPSTNATTTICSFRVCGKIPTLWDPETGIISCPPSWRKSGDGFTEVTIPFKPCGAVFVMFEPEEDKTAAPAENPPAKVIEKVVKGPFSVSFPTDWYTGGTNVTTVKLPALVDWTTLEDSNLKYFSGIATYEFQLPACDPAAKRVELDLGRVCNLAEVEVNGKALAIVWRPPYRVDITKAYRSPSSINKVRVRVVNLWPNRLIGDEQLKPDCVWDCVWIKEIPDWVKKGEVSPTGRHTFTTWLHWYGNSPLQPSGLLGPIQLRQSLDR